MNQSKFFGPRMHLAHDDHDDDDDAVGKEAKSYFFGVVVVDVHRSHQQSLTVKVGCPKFGVYDGKKVVAFTPAFLPQEKRTPLRITLVLKPHDCL